MRCAAAVVPGLCLVLFFTPASLAGVPSPITSSCAITGNSLPCQFRFYSDGTLDVLTVNVVLRDALGAPVANCPASATVSLIGPNPPQGCYPGTMGAALCSCCPNPQIRVSNAAGIVQFLFPALGGRGLAQVCVNAGAIAIGCKRFSFTSTDLNASCDAFPSPTTNIFDLGLWASCLPPGGLTCRAADYTCDCNLTISDLGVFAGGLSRPCIPVCP